MNAVGLILKSRNLKSWIFVALAVETPVSLCVPLMTNVWQLIIDLHSAPVLVANFSRNLPSFKISKQQCGSLSDHNPDY